MTQEWLSADPEKRKQCPNCLSGIEMEEGLNCFECKACKARLCWHCLAASSDADDWPCEHV